MISQAQKIDCWAFVVEKYFRFFRNRLIQQNQKRSLSSTLPFFPAGTIRPFPSPGCSGTPIRWKTRLSDIQYPKHRPKKLLTEF